MKIVLALTAVCLALVSTGVRADEGAEKAAVAASDAWLQLVDAGQHGASWDEAATLFKGAMTRDGWVAALKGVRPPLGKVLARTVTSRQHRESLPGAPDGKYVVAQYRTSFENKRSAVETVTSTLDKDGRWRVAGYFIK